MPAAVAKLPGIGRSTAAAIAAFAFGARGAILDGNVQRVLARHAAIAGFPGQAKVKRALWRRAEALLPRSGIEIYTQALMDLGATVCLRTRAALRRMPGCQAIAPPVAKTASRNCRRHGRRRHFPSTHSPCCCSSAKAKCCW